MAMMEMDLKQKLELAKDRRTPTHILMELSKDDDERVRYYVAWNFSTPEEALIKLADEEHWMIREAVAKHYNVPREILEKLARDPHYAVRIQVARNPYATRNIMWWLAHDKEWIVRREVAINAKGRDDISLRLLSKDECDFVLVEVARNIFTPKPEKEMLKAKGIHFDLMCS